MNSTLKDFQYILIKSVNKAFVEQMSIINSNIEKKIQDLMIKFQKTHSSWWKLAGMWTQLQCR